MIASMKMSDHVGKLITVRGVRPDVNYIDVTLVSVDPDGILVKDEHQHVYLPKGNVQAVELPA